ncbi:MAG: beta-ketoacyl-[acyl-carrier-protein] synthase family protein [Burkholderiaceae bacterium]|jgi:3-oxoacyl-[acyl-carrier-protein] synthase II|nr:beta-ketoacyl-[acyl-carrier-protein] synthase family protein [Burkholderiaceae bacterium]
MTRRVAVTGLGVVDPFEGLVPVEPSGDADATGAPPAPENLSAPQRFFDRVAAGCSASRLYVTEGIEPVISLPAVRCADFSAEARFGRALAGMMERFAQLGFAAARDAWVDAGLNQPANAVDPAIAGVCWGTALGGLLAFERGYRDFWQHGRRVAPMSVVLGMNNAATAHISIQLGLGNSALTYSVACASAACAIGEAFRHIRAGHAQLMVAGGSDATLAHGVLKAWEALKVLARSDAASAPHACRPFHPQRAGLVLGEGAAALVLEDWDRAVRRGATIYAEVAGYGANADHSHLVRPSEAGQFAALQAALGDAGLQAADIGYVNAHGTATREGDPVEIAALRKLFGPHAAALPVSATKAAHGHMMGATGAVEALLTVLALHTDVLPPTAHLDAVDPACAGVRHIQGSALRGTGARAALSNSFAFGGSNAVLAFKTARRR